MSSYDATFKIVLLGDSASKTTLVYRYLTGLFDQNIRMTTGVDYSVKALEIDGKKVKLQIWDFGGEERIRFLLPTYVRGADGALFIYDIANYTSINNIDDWLSVIRKEDRAEIPILLVGITSGEKNKRQVSVEDGKEIAKSKNLNGFIECSVRTGENVGKAFEALVRLVLANKISHPPPKPQLHPTSPPKPLEVPKRRPQEIKLSQDQFTNILSIIERFWNLQNSRIIAVTLIQGNNTILYSTDNWDNRFDVGIAISNWNSMNAQSIVFSGVKYSVILNTPTLFIVNSIGSKDHIVLAKDDDYTYIFRVKPNGDPTEGTYPYIFTPPEPPDDFEMPPLAQIRAPLKKMEPENEVNCQYCGRKLTKEEEITHSCKKKPKTL